MDADQFRTASEQLMLHFRRSGISYLPMPTSTGIDQATEWLNAHSSEWQNRTAQTAKKVETSPEVPYPTTVPDAVPTPTVMRMLVHEAVASVKSIQGERPIVATATQGLSIGTTAGWPDEKLSLEERTSKFELLNQQVMACRKCEDIVCRRSRTVFGVGPLDARIVMFGEAPGADEDRVGEPFVGAAGQLLNKILEVSGLKRENVYILNALKCRPPNNRTPVDVEIENCRPFFESQLETIQPQYIVCWGAVAVRSVLRSTESVGRLRGRFHHYRGAKVLVTYHPAYLLRNADAKKLTWEDMKMLMRELNIPIPPPNTKPR
jgi:uracil-DNA glycosylase